MDRAIAHSLTIVAYHYVRDLEGSRHPRIRGLTVEHFREQLDYIQRHYQVVPTEAVVAAALGDGESMRANALWLTFDDGYADHYETVFPILRRRGLTGAFFPAVRAVTEGRVLNVNKIQFALAMVEDPQHLVQEIFTSLDQIRAERELEPNAVYYARWAKPGRYDPADVVFVKRMLQKGLPEELRGLIAQRLFAKFVTDDELSFAEELYVSADQLREMQDAGMTIGSHGYKHDWLDSLSDEEQEDEIDRSLAFLSALDAPTDNWIMCYPYGAYDERLVDLLRGKGCAVGVTVKPDIARLGVDDPLLLPRLDTNNLPIDGTAPPNRWTHRVLQ